MHLSSRIVTLPGYKYKKFTASLLTRTCLWYTHCLNGCHLGGTCPDLLLSNPYSISLRAQAFHKTCFLSDTQTVATLPFFSFSVFLFLLTLFQTFLKLTCFWHHLADLGLLWLFLPWVRNPLVSKELCFPSVVTVIRERSGCLWCDSDYPHENGGQGGMSTPGHVSERAWKWVHCNVSFRTPTLSPLEMYGLL